MHDLDLHPNIRRRLLAMFALTFAGEAVFFLPFVLARVFRPTLLELFGLSNVELGIAFSAYGLVAMVAYFPGGPLADRFAPRKMMVVALFATSLGGLIMASIPSPSELSLLYAYWGITTILLFWAPLIRATRNWAGHGLPGRAFGILDGGRGLVAAAVGSFAVLLYTWLLPEDVTAATPAQRGQALQHVIFVFAGITCFAAVLVWIGLSDGGELNSEDRQSLHLEHIVRVLRMPSVWLQAIIIVCAYVGYKGLDDVSLYAYEVLQLNEVQAARASAITLWMRPVAAVGAGLIADRYGVTKMTALSFAVLTASSAAMAVGILKSGTVSAFYFTILTTSAAIFALRGLYFAIMEDGNIPFAYTGTAVGLVSVIGYTPDVFMGPVMGILIDGSPGAPGHQNVFAVVAAFAIIGLITTMIFGRLAIRRRQTVREAKLPELRR